MVKGRAFNRQDPETSSRQADRPGASIHDRFISYPATADLLQVFRKGEVWQQDEWGAANGNEFLNTVVL